MSLCYTLHFNEKKSLYLLSKSLPVRVEEPHNQGSRKAWDIMLTMIRKCLTGDTSEYNIDFLFLAL